MGIGKLRNGIVVEYDVNKSRCDIIYIPKNYRGKYEKKILEQDGYIYLCKGEGIAHGREYDIVDFNYEWPEKKEEKVSNNIKFKAGDKVRIVGEECGHGFAIGTVCVIRNVGNIDYRVECNDGKKRYCIDSELELVTEKEETKQPSYTSELRKRVYDYFGNIFRGVDNEKYKQVEKFIKSVIRLNKKYN